MEDSALVLDYLPQGLPGSKGFRRELLVYAIGESEFRLFELVPKPGAPITIGDRVYIGKEVAQRDQIEHVKRRVAYEELTAAAHAELPFVLKEMIKTQEARFIRFFNDSQPITIRLHSMELVPGLGKKTMKSVLDERRKSPFADFADLTKRVPALKHPQDMLARRIEQELMDPTEKYRLFVSDRPFVPG